MVLYIVVAASVSLSAQDAPWSVNAYAYQYDMSSYVSLVINGEAVGDYTDYAIGAFCGEECRGVAELTTVEGQSGTASFYYLRIRSNRENGETITFRVYKKSSQKVYETENSVSFVSQGLMGMPSQPSQLIVNHVTVTAKNLTRVYGEANPTLKYTVEGAALVGKPELSCEATATSPVGTYPIVVKKGGVENYNDTYVNGTLTITKAPLKISGGEYTIKQGEDIPKFAAVYEGFKNGETEAVLTKKPTLTTTAVKGSEPGTYEVKVSGAKATNYKLTYVAGTLTVNEADPVTVTAKNLTRVYGEANPALTYTVEGAALVGEPELSCEATATSPVGTYPIVVKKGGVENYNDTYVNGTLTITKAPLKISVGNYEKLCGEENPEFTLSYEGFKNGETKDVLTKQAVLTTKATQDSDPGDYVLKVSGASAKNYSISYVSGKLTIGSVSGLIEELKDQIESTKQKATELKDEATSIHNDINALVSVLAGQCQMVQNLSASWVDIASKMDNLMVDSNIMANLMEELHAVDQRISGCSDILNSITSVCNRLNIESEELQSFSQNVDELLSEVETLKNTARTVQDVENVKSKLTELDTVLKRTTDFGNLSNDIEAIAAILYDVDSKIAAINTDLADLQSLVDAVAMGIHAVGKEPRERADVFDLSGRKVNAQGKKGLYIVNGKKVLLDANGRAKP